MKNHIAEARKWLDLLRNGTDQYELFEEFVLEEARKGNLTLDEIGTSEGELEELIIKGCKTAAEMWLGLLRNGMVCYDSCISHIREEAGKGGLTLDEIGTSEKELASEFSAYEYRHRN